MPATKPVGAKRELTTAEREEELLDLIQQVFGLDYTGGTKVEVKGQWAELWSEIHKKGREYSRYRFRNPDDPSIPDSE